MEIDLVRKWQHGTTYLVDETFELELRCLFDFDYEYFLLFQRWDKNYPDDGWSYSLWFLGLETDGTRICTWYNQELGAPFVDAAELVEEWRREKHKASKKNSRIISSAKKGEEPDE